MVELKKNLLSVALLSALSMVATSAYAQTADQDKEKTEAEKKEDEAKSLDTVVVTGIRGSIERSIEAKQDADTIVEAISAEDIGKLPDTSIADSLARLPGLTAQRFGGRPQEINIRGFAGDFSTTLLNGREQVSLGNNRGVEFDQYPSEVMSSVLVHKTADAAMVNQGISGTVNLRTARPLDYDKRTIAVNVRGDMNKIAGGDKEYGYRASATYIDQFRDKTVGLALGYARLNNPGQGHQFESWGYPGGVPGGGKLYDIDNENERDGLMATLEFRPNDWYTGVLDVFYSRFDKDEYKRGMEYGLAWGSATLQPGSTVSNGTTTKSTWSNFRPVMRNDYNAAHDDLFSIGFNNEMKFDENWTVSVDLSHSSANRDERILETYAGLKTGLSDTITMTYNPDGYQDIDFGLDYANVNNFQLMDAGGWGQDGYLKDFEVEDSIHSVRLDLERNLDNRFFSNVQFGGNFSQRTKSRASKESKLCINACAGGSLAMPGFTDLRRFGFGGLDSLIGYDAEMALSLYKLQGNQHADIANKNWEVEEKVSTAYAQLGMNTDWGSTTVKGNIGVQFVHVNQSSNGTATYDGNAIGNPIQGGASYYDFLPSLNLNFGLPAGQYVRFGAGRQTARPRMDEMRANQGYGIDTQRRIWSGGGGNPELKSWLANAYDLSYEKYFGSKGYVSAAYFYKDLVRYIYNQRIPYDFSGFTLPANIAPGNIPASRIGEYSAPANGSGGNIKGWEFALNVPFDLFWAPLEGFGFIGNYSDTKSTISPGGPGTSEPFPGLSKYVSNMTLYYERYGFNARVSERHRSKFVGEVQGFGGDRYRETFNSESVYDAQVGYDFGPGALDGLSILFQVNNIKNAPFKSSYDSDPQRPNKYFEYGRTFLFGVNYKF